MRALSRAGFLAAVVAGAVPAAVAVPLGGAAPAAAAPRAVSVHAAGTVPAPAAEVSPLRLHGTYAHGTFLSGVPGPVFRGGVVRFTDAGPQLHVNSSHQSVGIIPSSVRVNEQGHLELRLDTTLPVISCSADPDETLVQRDISAGISGGGALCIVKMRIAGMPLNKHLNLAKAGDYAKVKGPTSNMWISIQSYYGGAL